MQLSKYIDLTSVSLSTAATNVVEVDTANCDGVLFVGVGATTAVRLWDLALKSGATTTGFVTCSTVVSIASTAAANHALLIDVFKPAKRYLGATLSSSAATPCYLLAFKYDVRKLPTTFSATANLPGVKVMAAVSPTSTG